MTDIENEAEIEAGRRNYEVTNGLLSRLNHIEASRLSCQKTGDQQVCHFQAASAKMTKLRKTIRKMSNDFPGGKPPEYEVVSGFWKDKFQQFLDMKSELAALEALDFLYHCGECRACVISVKRSQSLQNKSVEDDSLAENEEFVEYGLSEVFEVVSKKTTKNDKLPSPTTSSRTA